MHDDPQPPQSPDGNQVVVCPEALDLAYAPEFQGLLLTALSAGASLEIQANAVAQVDTANLQLLCATAKALSASGKRFEIRAPSPQFVRAAERLGLTAALGMVVS